MCKYARLYQNLLKQSTSRQQSSSKFQKNLSFWNFFPACRQPLPTSNKTSTCPRYLDEVYFIILFCLTWQNLFHLSRNLATQVWTQIVAIRLLNINLIVNLTIYVLLFSLILPYMAEFIPPVALPRSSPQRVLTLLLLETQHRNGGLDGLLKPSFAYQQKGRSRTPPISFFRKIISFASVGSLSWTNKGVPIDLATITVLNPFLCWLVLPWACSNLSEVGVSPWNTIPWLLKALRLFLFFLPR